MKCLFALSMSDSYIADFAIKNVIIAPKLSPFVKPILIILTGYRGPTPKHPKPKDSRAFPIPRNIAAMTVIFSRKILSKAPEYKARDKLLL